jgi:hypothetical protein
VAADRLDVPRVRHDHRHPAQLLEEAHNRTPSSNPNTQTQNPNKIQTLKSKAMFQGTRVNVTPALDLKFGFHLDLRFWISDFLSFLSWYGSAKRAKVTFIIGGSHEAYEDEKRRGTAVKKKRG